MTASSRPCASVHGLLCLCGLIIACAPSADRKPRKAPAALPFTVSVTPRGRLQIAEPDSLSDSARVISLAPEGDGDGVAFTFADPVHHIGAGLGFIDRHRVRAILIWPDSVTAVWWPAPHQLAFTAATGAGVHLVVDIHAPSPTIIADTVPSSTAARGAAPMAPDSTALGRARHYVDSLHMQLPGATSHAALQYGIGRLLAAPGDSMATFYAIATDARNGEYNPSWYMLDVRSGQVRAIDQVVGPAGAMPRDAAGWDTHGDFFYVKDATLYQARPAR